MTDPENVAIVFLTMIVTVTSTVTSTVCSKLTLYIVIEYVI